MHPAPFCIALEMKLFPSLFFPFIVKNKLSFLIVLVSIESPLKLIFLSTPNNFFTINLFCR